MFVHWLKKSLILGAKSPMFVPTLGGLEETEVEISMYETIITTAIDRTLIQSLLLFLCFLLFIFENATINIVAYFMN